ncbi:MAG TPA: GNAT family N-acetyltransferase [Verrucomicrobiae bacterium]|nr:GNAT family N-acetyltransferase [Verrucomicrobiae bacterium]
MRTIVRSADLHHDGPQIVDFLARNHTPESTTTRFEWLYSTGTAGEARSWIACDQVSGEVIGVAAAFPRRMRVFGEELPGWVLGDFCIDPRHRALGPALQLQKACLESLQSEAPAIYYDFPSPAMTAVYERLGISINQRLVRLVKPLRFDAKISRVIRQPQIATAMTAVVNRGLLVFSNRRRAKAAVDLIPCNIPCGEEFTEFARSANAGLGICLLRSAEYLNWRFRGHPYRQHEIATLRRGDLLAGYAVIHDEGLNLNVVDLFCQAADIRELIGGVIRIAEDRRKETVTVGVLDSQPYRKILRRLGFFRREKTPVVTFWTGRVLPPADAGWFLTNGDRES